MWLADGEGENVIVQFGQKLWSEGQRPQTGGVGMRLERGTAEPWRWDREYQQLRHLTGNFSPAQNKQAGVSFSISNDISAARGEPSW